MGICSLLPFGDLNVLRPIIFFAITEFYVQPKNPEYTTLEFCRTQFENH
jgi:hypothetical protein